MHGASERFELGDARGESYAPVPDELRAQLLDFLDGKPPPGAEVLKADAVWRVGAWCAKRFDPRSRPKDWLRASPASRSARLHFELAPVRTPRPLVTLDRRGGRAGSLLVAEFVAGTFLQRSWESEAARTSLPAFFAALNSRGWFHGDLHARNLIWTGADWVLIDLEGVRPRVHGLLLRRRIEVQWARLVCALSGHQGVRAAFESYADAMKLPDDRDELWRRIEARAARLAPKWKPARS